MDLVTKMAEENRIKIEAEQQAAQEAERRTHEKIPQAHDKEPSEKDLYRPEKLEEKRMKKRQRQRDILGKQPLPESYVKPNIAFSGGFRNKIFIGTRPRDAT